MSAVDPKVRDIVEAHGQAVADGDMPRALDRDINAAINVARAAGLAVTACGARVRPGLISAQRGEAGTHPKPRQQAA